MAVHKTKQEHPAGYGRGNLWVDLLDVGILVLQLCFVLCFLHFVLHNQENETASKNSFCCVITLCYLCSLVRAWPIDGLHWLKVSPGEARGLPRHSRHSPVLNMSERSVTPP